MQVGSRRVVQISAVFMVALGIFNKFGALFVTVPDPVIGASFFILFGQQFVPSHTHTHTQHTQHTSTCCDDSVTHTHTHTHTLR